MLLLLFKIRTNKITPFHSLRQNIAEISHAMRPWHLCTVCWRQEARTDCSSLCSGLHQGVCATPCWLKTFHKVVFLCFIYNKVGQPCQQRGGLEAFFFLLSSLFSGKMKSWGPNEQSYHIVKSIHTCLFFKYLHYIWGIGAMCLVNCAQGKFENKI